MGNFFLSVHKINKITKRMLDEIYLLYVSNTYHMHFECVWVHLYLLEATCGCIDVYNSHIR
jgi:hypothetical protein